MVKAAKKPYGFSDVHPVIKRDTKGDSVETHQGKQLPPFSWLQARTQSVSGMSCNQPEFTAGNVQQ